MSRLSLRGSATANQSEPAPSSASHSPSKELGQEDDTPAHITNTGLSGFFALKGKVNRAARHGQHGREQTPETIAAEGIAKSPGSITLDNWDSAAVVDIRAWKSTAQNLAKQRTDTVEGKNAPEIRTTTENQGVSGDELRRTADDEGERAGQLRKTAEVQPQRLKRDAIGSIKSHVTENEDGALHSKPSAENILQRGPRSSTPSSRSKSPSITRATQAKSSPVRTVPLPWPKPLPDSSVSQLRSPPVTRASRYKNSSSARHLRAESPSNTPLLRSKASSNTGAPRSKSTSTACTCYTENGARCTNCVQGVISSELISPNIPPRSAPLASIFPTGSESITKTVEEAPSEPAKQRGTSSRNKRQAPSKAPLKFDERSQSSTSSRPSFFSRVTKHIKRKWRGSAMSRGSLSFRPASRAESRGTPIRDDYDNSDDFDPEEEARSVSQATLGRHHRKDRATVQAWNEQVPTALRYPDPARHARHTPSNPQRNYGLGLIAHARTAHPDFQNLDVDEDDGEVKGAPVPGSFPGALAPKGSARRMEQDAMDLIDVEYEMVPSFSKRGQATGSHYAPSGPGLLRSMSVEFLAQSKEPYDRQYAVESRMENYRHIEREEMEMCFESTGDDAHALERPSTSMSTRSQAVQTPHRRSLSAMSLRTPQAEADYGVRPHVQTPHRRSQTTMTFRKLPAEADANIRQHVPSSTRRSQTTMGFRDPQPEPDYGCRQSAQSSHRRSQSTMEFRKPQHTPVYSAAPRVQLPIHMLGGETLHSNGFRAPGNMVYSHMLDEEDAPKPRITSYAPSKRHGTRLTHSRMSSLTPVHEEEIASQHEHMYPARSPDGHPSDKNILRTHITESRMGHYRTPSRGTTRERPTSRSASAAGMYRPPTAGPSRTSVRERDYIAARPGSATGSYAPSTMRQRPASAASCYDRLAAAASSFNPSTVRLWPASAAGSYVRPASAAGSFNPAIVRLRPASAAGSYGRNASRASSRAAGSACGLAYDEQKVRMRRPLMEVLYGEV